MKHFFVIIFIFVCTQICFASFPKPSVADSVQTHSSAQPSLLPLQNMKVKDYEQRTGKKLNLLQKFAFKLAQKRMKNEAGNEEKNKAGNAIGGFALGFFLLPIGVLIAYLLPKNKTLRKWALIGFGVAATLLLIYVILVAVLLSSL